MSVTNTVQPIVLKGEFNTAKIFATHIEDEAIRILLTYLNSIISLFQKIRVMPDVHAGKGVVIGFTADMNLNNPEGLLRVVPNVIGVDIGCGVLTVNLGREVPPFDEVDRVIRERIPAGFAVHETKAHLKQVPLSLLNKVKDVAERTGQDISYVYRSLGTLGGGNHFIEIGQSQQTGEYWITVHSGSRNFGLKVAKHYQDLAYKTYKNDSEFRKELEMLKAKYTGEVLAKKIRELKDKYRIPKSLAYLTGDLAQAYLQDMKVAQEYAKWNRRLMINTILDYFGIEPKQIIESVHNYINFEDGILRKGAISAHKDEDVVIPMHMAFGVVIGKGKGNPDWNYSAPHGAGRRMSRAEAKRRLTVEEFAEKMRQAGVFSTSVSAATLDEAPDAYKDPDEVLALLKETVEITDIVKSVYNFKA